MIFYMPPVAGIKVSVGSISSITVEDMPADF